MIINWKGLAAPKRLSQNTGVAQRSSEAYAGQEGEAVISNSDMAMQPDEACGEPQPTECRRGFEIVS